jgi:hypothetical protein
MIAEDFLDVISKALSEGMARGFTTRASWNVPAIRRKWPPSMVA